MFGSRVLHVDSASVVAPKSCLDKNFKGVIKWGIYWIFFSTRKKKKYEPCPNGGK